MMTVQAAPLVRKDHHAKKSSLKIKSKEGGTKNILSAVSEHSLSGFLDDEPRHLLSFGSESQVPMKTTIVVIHFLF